MIMQEQEKRANLSKEIKIKSGILAGKPLGDAVADFTHATGIVKLAECYTNVTGNDCGCNQRQEFLNRMFPG